MLVDMLDVVNWPQNVSGRIKKAGAAAPAVNNRFFTMANFAYGAGHGVPPGFWKSLVVQIVFFPKQKTPEFGVPEEFQNKLNENSALKAAFEALTPGRQRGYLLYFAAAKQSKTRESRIEKCMDLIFDGKGLQDDY